LKSLGGLTQKEVSGNEVSLIVWLAFAYFSVASISFKSTPERNATFEFLGMDFHTRTVHRNHLDIYPDDLFLLQFSKGPVDNSAFCIAAYTVINGVSVPIFFKQRPPLATIFRNIQKCIENLQISICQFATMLRDTIRYLIVLDLC
jgi:hypothetical protein